MRRRSRSGGPSVLPTQHEGHQPLSIIRAFDHETNPSRPVRPSPLAASAVRGMPLDFVERIRTFPVFASAPDSFLAAIGSHVHLQVYSAQANILTEGDEAKAMYWLVRGTVVVTSRDRESTYAELKPGSFFGEIGILMNIPRTASVVARHKSLVIRLNKEDLQKELPNYPEVERAIRDEAAERFAILKRKRKQVKQSAPQKPTAAISRNGKRMYEQETVESDMEDGLLSPDQHASNKRRKSASPTLKSPKLIEAVANSALSSGTIYIRELLKSLPLFSSLPNDIMHFIGLNAQPRTFPPFTEIVRQGSEGRDVYFITDGDVEVFTDSSLRRGATKQQKAANGTRDIKARLKSGQYFGEVTSLSLAPQRTACVRSVTSTECLVISGEVIDELMERCSPELRRSVEATAKARLKETIDTDIPMLDAAEGSISIGDLAIADAGPLTNSNIDGDYFSSPSQSSGSPPRSPGRDRVTPAPGPLDPDLFFNADKISQKPLYARRGSYSSTPTNASPLAEGGFSRSPSPIHTPNNKASSSPQKNHSVHNDFRTKLVTRPKFISRQASHYGKGKLPDFILIQVFQHLDVGQLMRFRAVSLHWSKLLSTSPDILHELDLSKCNRKITDHILTDLIAPFVGPRPRYIDISNCFHITDEGFAALVLHCAANVRVWRMKSVWDISPQTILDMANKAKSLSAIDFSNCRKVSDNLLARTVGWVVRGTSAHAAAIANAAAASPSSTQAPHPPPEGTVVGCPKLDSLTLSYCKHVSDRFMAHLALHAADRLRNLDITRCTTITDMGFRHWGERQFPKLQRLVLADCTYLTDSAIICLTRCAKALKELDLSFCCALSDTAVESLATGCPTLQRLNLAFCGSAVSDSSMQAMGAGLHNLLDLSVRGCVRVTSIGVEAILEGCTDLTKFDVSQCRSLTPWLEDGGMETKGREIEFICVTDGAWRMSGT